MGKKKHPFIDKKTAQKFKVVHRSQRDPLQADAESAQHVLVPAGTEGIPDGNDTSEVSQEEKTKYGIYYDDDYDYLQHLRPRGEGMLIMAEDFGPPRPKPKPKPKECDDMFGIKLPSEALPSKYEEDIGMLNKGVLPRGPQPDWDPDIVACLDDDIDLDNTDNLLEDDFIMLANEEGLFGNEGASYNDNSGHVFHKDFDYIPADYVPDNMPDLEDLPMGGPVVALPTVTAPRMTTPPMMVTREKAHKDGSKGSDISSGNMDLEQDLSDFEDEDSADETKSRFTDYSMTSSVIRRTQGLKILDDRFERIMEEYDEEEVGARDHEEITIGNINPNDDLMNQIVEEFIIDHTKIPFEDAVDEAEVVDAAGDSCGESEEDDVDKLFEQFEKKEKQNWDCESIISTYSNIYNHPKIIEEPKFIKLHPRSGIPLGVLKDNTKNTKDEEMEEDEGVKEQIILNNIRRKTETPEEKKARKQDVKKFRAERRKEKKDNKMCFKDEHRKQEQISMNRSNLIAIP